ncbi:MAG: hypothetical protein ACI8RD_003386 [Bacillariaceae sp.]|jgi:hypothetical protein
MQNHQIPKRAHQYIFFFSVCKTKISKSINRLKFDTSHIALPTNYHNTLKQNKTKQKTFNVCRKGLEENKFPNATSVIFLGVDDNNVYAN